MGKKDKPVRKMNMKSLAKDLDVLDADMDIQEDKKEFDGFTWDIATAIKCQEYNQNIEQLDKDYSTFKSRNGIIVRVFLHIPEVKGDIVVPIMNRIPIKTSNGIGTLGEVESPYPYSKRAIVVSVPEIIKDIKPGDIVQLSGDIIRAVPLGGGKSAALAIPNAFTLWTYKEQHPPTDPSNKHYGYLQVNSRSIEGIVG